MKWKYALGLLLTIIAVGVLIAFSRPLAEAIVGLFYKPTEVATSTRPIAQIQSYEGLVYVDRKKNDERITTQVTSPTQLLHLDQVRTEKGSRTTLSFASGWVVELSLRTTVVVESYRPEEVDSPALLSVVYGDIAIVKEGTSGQLFIAQGSEIEPAGAPTQAFPRQIELTKKEAQQPEKNGPVLNVPTPTEPDSKDEKLPSASQPGKMPEKMKTGDEETLTNSHIEEVLGRFTDDFRRCQLNNLRDRPDATGSILISLTIQGATGRPTNLKVLQNSTKNNQLADCAKEVVSRAKFRTFSGLPITITYPLEFK